MPDVAAGEGPIVVRVDAVVPAWLGELVVLGASAGRSVAVALHAPEGLAGDARAGWEIGAATAALRAGADVVGGIDPVRLARVRAVVVALGSAGRPEAGR
jgi:hypothetical protein